MLQERKPDATSEACTSSPPVSTGTGALSLVPCGRAETLGVRVRERPAIERRAGDVEGDASLHDHAVHNSSAEVDDEESAVFHIRCELSSTLATIDPPEFDRGR